jgi:nucleoside-diphosphate-sugar epimerase
LKILITGGTGYLGGKVASSLVDEGHTIAFLVRGSSNLSRLPILRANFEIGKYSSDAEIHEFVEKIKPEVIIHAACCYGRSNESHQEIIHSNISLGVSLLDSLTRLKDEVSFINISTSLPSGINFYALTKNEFINFGKWFCEKSQNKLNFLNIVCEHFYGEGERDEKFIPSIIKKCLDNAECIDLTLGEQKRDFIYIDDLINGLLLILSNLDKFVQFQSLEIGSGKPLKIRDVVEKIHFLTNSKSILRFGAIPYRLNEIMESKVNLTKLKTLGWSPKIDFDTGIQKVIRTMV